MIFFSVFGVGASGAYGTERGALWYQWCCRNSIISFSNTSGHINWVFERELWTKQIRKYNDNLLIFCLCVVDDSIEKNLNINERKKSIHIRIFFLLFILWWSGTKNMRIFPVILSRQEVGRQNTRHIVVVRCALDSTSIQNCSTQNRNYPLNAAPSNILLIATIGIPC